jgi:hypothetical protein
MDQLEIQSWSPLPGLPEKNGLVFMRRGRLYLNVLLPYRKISGEVSVMEVPREDGKVHGIVWQNNSILKKELIKPKPQIADPWNHFCKECSKYLGLVSYS